MKPKYVIITLSRSGFFKFAGFLRYSLPFQIASKTKETVLITNTRCVTRTLIYPSWTALPPPQRSLTDPPPPQRSLTDPRSVPDPSQRPFGSRSRPLVSSRRRTTTTTTTPPPPPPASPARPPRCCPRLLPAALRATPAAARACPAAPALRPPGPFRSSPAGEHSRHGQTADRASPAPTPRAAERPPPRPVRRRTASGLLPPRRRRPPGSRSGGGPERRQPWWARARAAGRRWRTPTRSSTAARGSGR